MKNKIVFIFLAMGILCAMTACYRMPTDDDYSLIPSTNNPAFSRQKTNEIPGLGY